MCGMGRPWLSVVEPFWLRRLFALRAHQLVRDGKALVVGWLVFAFRFGTYFDYLPFAESLGPAPMSFHV